MFTCKMWRISLRLLNLQIQQNKLINNKQFSALLSTKVIDKLNSETEKEYLVKLKVDPDHFGAPVETETLDEGDLAEEAHFTDQPLPTQRLSTKKYADHIKELIGKRKIKEALDYVEIKMLKEDRVKPESYIYNLLLGACGRVGYTKKAFMLYNDMKRRGLNITGGTYTALFNACSNSPWPEDGLKRAKHLREIMMEKLYQPNETNYNAMIKAFGRCGDLATAFSLVDEMKSKAIPIKIDTMNFLLQASISDKEAGYRHALLLWRKILAKRITPDLYTFNLMLRTVRDCGLGDANTMQEALDEILKVKPRLGGDTKLLLQVSPTPDPKLLITYNSSLTEVNTDRDYLPNLMAPVPHLGSIVSLTEVKEPKDKLLLIGGLKGFLQTMEDNQIKPNFKTFNLLLHCIPSNMESEKELMTTMRKYRMKPDLDFLNILMKKRSLRARYGDAKDVLKLIDEAGYKPNVMTFGILAMGCKTIEEAKALIEQIKNHSYTLNAEIMGAMLFQACYHKQFPYVIEIMDLMVKEKVKVNKKFLEHFERLKTECKAMLKDKNNKRSRHKGFINGFGNFQKIYKTWINEVEKDETEQAHPWQQYRQPTDTDVRHYTDKSSRFKPRHLSKFRVKTSPKYKQNCDNK